MQLKQRIPAAQLPHQPGGKQCPEWHPLLRGVSWRVPTPPLYTTVLWGGWVQWTTHAQRGTWGSAWEGARMGCADPCLVG